MHFNPSKCTILSQNNKSAFYYKIKDEILQSVEASPYLGVEISKDLKWSSQISKITAKANSTLGLLKRNLRHCQLECKKTAYMAMIRSKLEYARVVWDPNLQKDIDKLNQSRRKQYSSYITIMVAKRLVI